MLFDADGEHGLQLNPEGTVAVDLEFWDFLERGRISESWSSDGSRIAFGAYVLAAEASALYVAKSDGTAVRQIVSPDVGAVTAQWSSDGTWIAFTSKLKAQPQIWRVHPDGSGLQQLTDGAEGTTSVAAVWSPDGSKLLFERKQAGHVTLWTMNADGGNARQLSPTPLSDDYFGPYAWWPAPLS
jgi:Tol biopolymer transport system component